ncbi:hypothetical protein GCM10010967_12210 [Dyadobacter beijingensis]|uniref:Uncharacterized protein n=1 Tax=Dyadobacter beijingensis TaxID=365489 RepID=A0ABQ2HIV4_9BACT|nr:hypothetical protein [Dyadobacter beijingensis]GGM82059.1 hypothetical protein GCM10010967_12210 [Dyadobacter beijingensis]
MELSRTTMIPLTIREIQLAHYMIKSHEMHTTGKKPPGHASLASKIVGAHLGHRLGGVSRVIVHYTDAEKQLLRQYNQEYCELLAKALPMADESDQAEIVTRYAIATNIQMLFSPRR